MSTVSASAGLDAGPGCARGGDDQRDARGLLVIGVLAPHAVVAQVPAVVAPEHDDRVPGETSLVERVEHAAQLGVHVAHGGVVAMDELALLFGGERSGLGHVAVLPQLAPRRGCERWCALGRCLPPRRLERRTLVQVPVLLGRDERQVRLEEPDRQEERLAGSGLGGAQAGDGFVGNQAIGVGGIGHVSAFGSGAARAAHGGRARRGSAFREQIIADLGPPMRHRPGSLVLVIAVPDVHDFAHRFGAVSVPAEILGHRDRVRHAVAEMGRQVVDPDGLRAQARHQRVARRRADSLVAERPLEQHAPRGQPVDVRGLDDGRAVAAQQRFEVVHANQQDVGLVAGADRSRCRQQQHGQSKNRVVHVDGS